jgi:N-dimethylarginine dimethylaminohydrolase
MNDAQSGALNETGRITRVVLKHARAAFGDLGAIEAQWRELHFTAAPDYDRAMAEYDRFQELVALSGAEIRWLPVRGGVGLDSIYVRDAATVCARGVILCSMGKAQRAWEPAAHEDACREWDVPIAGAIRPPGRLEGGDVVWLDDRTVAVGRGYRTNDEGIRQFARLVGEAVEVITVPLPHWRGPGDVFHLMSIISPVDRDLAVVYSPLMPVPFRDRLLERDVRLVEVPDGEFESMGANVLAIAPRRAVMIAGNPRTRTLLEAAGVEVLVYAGAEISIKGGGGPTCLARPIARAAA